MDMTFQEKSLWVMLVGSLVGFGVYFSAVLPGHGASVLPQDVVLFAVAVAMLVAISVAGHVIIAVLDQRTDADERDRSIELAGTRNASYVLATGVFTSLCVALLIPGNFAFTHVLLAFWVLAQLVQIASQLVRYRRDA